MRAVKQLIARVDDRLHARLKERARFEGRSMNALVVEALEEAAPELSPRERFRERLRAAGRLYEPPEPPRPTISREEAIARTRGAGRAVLDALDADRGPR